MKTNIKTEIHKTIVSLIGHVKRLEKKVKWKHLGIRTLTFKPRKCSCAIIPGNELLTFSCESKQNSENMPIYM